MLKTMQSFITLQRWNATAWDENSMKLTFLSNINLFKVKSISIRMLRRRKGKIKQRLHGATLGTILVHHEIFWFSKLSTRILLKVNNCWSRTRASTVEKTRLFFKAGTLSKCCLQPCVGSIFFISATFNKYSVTKGYNSNCLQHCTQCLTVAS